LDFVSPKILAEVCFTGLKEGCRLSLCHAMGLAVFNDESPLLPVPLGHLVPLLDCQVHWFLHAKKASPEGLA